MFAACPFSLPGYEPSAVGAKLLAPASGWFFIRILISLTASEAASILSPANITLGPADLAMAGLYRKYLTRDQVLYLQSQPEFQVYEVPVEIKGATLKRETMMLSDDLVPKKYVVRGIPGWQPDHDNVTILGRWTDELYVVEALSEEHLVFDRNVSSVFDYIPRSLTNRYTNGFLRSGQQTLKYTDDYIQTLSPERYKYTELTGAGQVICVVDSGLDPSHPFFVHNKETYGYPGKYNENMRKVVLYDNYGDGGDEIDGHGTHVAGTIAGYAVDEKQLAIQRYGGMAHGAKLYVVDVMVAGSEYLVDFNSAAVAHNMNAIPDCRISSNSWGSDQSDPRSTQMYSVLAASYRDQLYVFAAGNSEHWVNSPGDSHNVLSVAAISSLPASTATKFIFTNFENQAFGNVVIEVLNGGKVTRFDGREISTHPSNYYMYRSDRFDEDQERFLNITAADVYVHEGMITAEQVNEQENYGKRAVVLINSQSGVIEDYVRLPVIQTSENVRAAIQTGERVSFYAGPSKDTDYKVSRAYFSSQGPSYYGTDGPDIAAPGEYIFSARSSGGAEYSTTFRTKISVKSGTSMATPAISGLAALVRQYLLTKTTDVPSTLLRAVLINSAESYGLPRTQVGHGVPCLKTIVDVPMLHHSGAIGAASHKKYTVNVKTELHPLRVTLSYLDQPLNLAENADKIYPFFLDLDLIVISPSGKVYHGNEMVDSFASNEKVIVESPEAGDYEIHVTSTNPGLTQHVDNYSVVASGDINVDAIATFEPVETNMCIDNCNGHGTCSSGHCTCESGWIGKYCEKQINAVTEGDDFKDTFKHKEIHYYQFKRREDKNYVQIEYENEDSKRQPILHAVYACLSATPSYISMNNWLCIRAPGNHVWLGWHKNSMNMTDDIYMAMWVVSNYTTTLKVTYTDEDKLHTGGLPTKAIAIISGVVVGVVVIAIIVVVIMVWRARS